MADPTINEIRAWATSNYASGAPHIPEDVPSYTRVLLAALDSAATKEREQCITDIRSVVHNVDKSYVQTAISIIVDIESIIRKRCRKDQE